MRGQPGFLSSSDIWGVEPPQLSHVSVVVSAFIIVHMFQSRFVFVQLIQRPTDDSCCTLILKPFVASNFPSSLTLNVSAVDLTVQQLELYLCRFLNIIIRYLSAAQ